MNKVKLTICVFVDYGIATIQEGLSGTEYKKIIEATKSLEGFVTSYELEVEIPIASHAE